MAGEKGSSPIIIITSGEAGSERQLRVRKLN